MSSRKISFLPLAAILASCTAIATPKSQDYSARQKATTGECTQISSSALVSPIISLTAATNTLLESEAAWNVNHSFKGNYASISVGGCLEVDADVHLSRERWGPDARLNQSPDLVLRLRNVSDETLENIVVQPVIISHRVFPFQNYAVKADYVPNQSARVPVISPGSSATYNVPVEISEFFGESYLIALDVSFDTQWASHFALGETISFWGNMLGYTCERKDISRFVDPSCPAVLKIADNVKKIYDEKTMGKFDLLRLVHEELVKLDASYQIDPFIGFDLKEDVFVHNIQPPTEMFLRDSIHGRKFSGDCEDFMIFYASVWEALGGDYMIGLNQNHAWLYVDVGPNANAEVLGKKPWLAIECTSIKRGDSLADSIAAGKASARSADAKFYLAAPKTDRFISPLSNIIIRNDSVR